MYSNLESAVVASERRNQEIGDRDKLLSCDVLQIHVCMENPPIAGHAMPMTVPTGEKPNDLVLSMVMYCAHAEFHMLVLETQLLRKSLN